MKKIIVVTLLCVIHACIANTTNKNVMFKVLNPYLKEETTDKLVTINYEKELIITSVNTPTNKLYDFALLYLYYESGLYEFRRGQIKIALKDDALKTIKNYSKICNWSKAYLNSKCILEYLSIKYKIKVDTITENY